jgi:hypothetical protein
MTENQWIGVILLIVGVGSLIVPALMLLGVRGYVPY